MKLVDYSDKSISRSPILDNSVKAKLLKMLGKMDSPTLTDHVGYHLRFVDKTFKVLTFDGKTGKCSLNKQNNNPTLVLEVAKIYLPNPWSYERLELISPFNSPGYLATHLSEYHWTGVNEVFMCLQMNTYDLN